MARTKAYQREISRDISKINYRLKGIEQMLGPDSEQYQRYVNSITASLPVGSYHLGEDGLIRVKGGKMQLQSLKKEQLRAPAGLPTAKQSIRQQKKEMTRAVAQAGESVDISDEQALNELNAKTFVRGREDAKGKLKYNESMKAELSMKGKKSYQQLQEIIKKGEQKEDEKKAAKRARTREASKRYYERHKAEIAERRRAKRAAARLS